MNNLHLFVTRLLLCENFSRPSVLSFSPPADTRPRCSLRTIRHRRRSLLCCLILANGLRSEFVSPPSTVSSRVRTHSFEPRTSNAHDDRGPQDPAGVCVVRRKDSGRCCRTHRCAGRADLVIESSAAGVWATLPSFSMDLSQPTA